MPVLNYTTTISPDKTIAEITKRLAEHGASRIATDYAEGQPTGLTFVMPNPDTGRIQHYTLPVDVKAMHLLLQEQDRAGNLPGTKAVRSSWKQAERVAWRVTKDWLLAQLALAETRMVNLDEIMLPYMHVDDSGTTVLDNYRARALELTVGDGS